MGLCNNENITDSNGYNEVEDIENGWSIGYEIEIEGTGLENFSALNYNEAEGTECDDNDDENDSFYSNDSDNEIRHIGYQPLQSEIINNDIVQNDYNTKPNLDAFSNSTFSKYLLPLENNTDSNVSNSQRKISLNEDQISEIKATMSKIYIQPPQWAKDFEDKELIELLQKIKKKN